MKHLATTITGLVLLTVLSAFVGRAPQAQLTFPAASPPSLVRNQVGLTTVELEYGRPAVRGRKVFGGLVPFGEVWRTGANTASKITFSKDVTFGGEDVAAGTYGLFSIPGESEWTIILNKNPEQWGAYAYDAAQDVVRVQAKSTKLAVPVESLTINLSDVVGAGANLAIEWDTTRVTVPIVSNVVNELMTEIEAVMASDMEQKPYLQAAMFFYEHDLDLDLAVQWADAACKQQPEAVWIVYRKGLIQAKAGDKAGAKATAERTLELAQAAGGSLGDEYRRLGEALIESLGN